MRLGSFILLLLLLLPGHHAWSADDDEKEETAEKAEKAESAQKSAGKVEKRVNKPKLFLPAIEGADGKPLPDTEFEFDFADFESGGNWKTTFSSPFLGARTQLCTFANSTPI